MGKYELREKLQEDAENAGFIVNTIKHDKLEDRFSLILEHHLKNGKINPTKIPLYDLNLSKSGKFRNAVLPNLKQLHCQYYIEGYEEDLWDPPFERGIYAGNELRDFNALKPDFVYRDSKIITLIESKLGATQSYPHYQNMAICAQYARYADWMISAKINRKMKTRNFITLAPKGFLTETTDKIPREFKAALEYNSRIDYINSYYMIWEDILASYQKN